MNDPCQLLCGVGRRRVQNSTLLSTLTLLSIGLHPQSASAQCLLHRLRDGMKTLCCAYIEFSLTTNYQHATAFVALANLSGTLSNRMCEDNGQSRRWVMEYSGGLRLSLSRFAVT